jgi:hypothetical protein
LAAEHTRQKTLQSAYNLKRYGEKAQEIQDQPWPQTRPEKIKRAREGIRDIKTKVAGKLKGETIDLALVLQRQVQRTLAQFQTNLRAWEGRSHRDKIPESVRDERRKKLEKEMDQQLVEKGFAPGKGTTGMFQAGHKLEALDPKHRDYDHLHQWYMRWTEEKWPGKSLSDFFEWVEGFEVEEYGAELPRTRYISSEDERKKYKLGFKGGKPYYSERQDFYRSQMYDIQQPQEERRKAEDKAKRADKPFGQGIYVMTPDKEFYGRRENVARKATFHHSSFLAGLPVGAAGHMRAVGILTIDLESGHYAPRMVHMLNAVRGIEAKGLKAEEFAVRPIASDFVTKIRTYVAKDFVDELKELKKSKGQTGRILKQIADRTPVVKQQLTEAYQAV